MCFQVQLSSKQIIFTQGDLSDHLQSLSEQTEVPFLPRAVSPYEQMTLLNQLRPQILQSDDLDLISLFHRAVRNHDSLYPACQTEPVMTQHDRPCDYLTPEVHLTLDVHEEFVRVTSRLTVKRQKDTPFLVLDGREHDIESVKVNGRELEKKFFSVTANELIIRDIPDEEEFEVEVVSRIDPNRNDSMEGLYRSGKWLTTHCEAEGARRIFYGIDRPENLCRFTTTIIADKEIYPYRMSHGNLVSETKGLDGRAVVVWKDPIPKPGYLFAAVLGAFGVVSDAYQTRSGRTVKLEIYVEKGKENRAQFSLFVLKKAMQFDEFFFDREYLLNEMKVVADPYFNNGAMENTGLLIFNERSLLIDPDCGTDVDYARIAKEIMYKYAYNWSGNRVAIRDQFELAEAFTDFMAMLFQEWMFGEEYSRPKQVADLKERQFSEDRGPMALSNDLFDSTTYMKGREVFRMLHTILADNPYGDFRKAQNAYFRKYDGQAATSQELFSTVTEVCRLDLTAYERWFHQTGTPTVTAAMIYDRKHEEVKIMVKQSCPCPKNGREQNPFHIPLIIELLGQDGKTLIGPIKFDFTNRREVYRFHGISQKPIPVFLHGYSAPVKLSYEYSDRELGVVMLYVKDSYCRAEFAKTLLVRHLKQMYRELTTAGKTKVSEKLLETYSDLLQSEILSPYSKAQLLEMPSLRAIIEEEGEYDFHAASKAINMLKTALGTFLEEEFLQLLMQYPEPMGYDPTSETFIEAMKVRSLRNLCWSFLFLSNENKYLPQIVDRYFISNNLNNRAAMLSLIVDSASEEKERLLGGLYEEWKEDKSLISQWFSYQSGSSCCTVKTLETLQRCEAYDEKNPSHLRSVFLMFVNNPDCYHTPDGAGYEYVTDAILRISEYNPFVAMNCIAKEAYRDFEKLPFNQKRLMAKQLRRFLETEGVEARLRSFAGKILKIDESRIMV